jgi:hypothetical protein
MKSVITSSAAALLVACSVAAEPLMDAETERAVVTQALGEDRCGTGRAGFVCDLDDMTRVFVGSGTPSRTGIPYVSVHMAIDQPEGETAASLLNKRSVKEGLGVMERYGITRQFVIDCIERGSKVVELTEGLSHNCLRVTTLTPVYISIRATREGNVTP